MRQQAGIPARMVVTDQFGAAADLTGDQYAQTMAAYNAFQHRVKTSIIQVHNHHASLPGGGMVEMRHSFGTNTVRVVVPKAPVPKVDVLPSGIMIALSDLQGNQITDRLLLVPRVQPGTRTATGQWRIRTPKPEWRGGKAVNTDSTGRQYFTGVRGAGYTVYSIFGQNVNSQAYWTEAWGDSYPEFAVFRHGKQVALLSPLNEAKKQGAPLPFIIEWTDGTKYAAQLRFVGGSTIPLHEIPLNERRVELLVGPIKTNPWQFVGSVVASIPFSGIWAHSLQWQNLTFSADGRQARAVAVTGFAEYVKVTFHITPASLTVEHEVLQNQAPVSQYAAPVNILTRTGFGSTHVPRTETEYRQTNGNMLNNDGTPTYDNYGGYGTGNAFLPEIKYPVYAFGPKGQDFDYLITGAPAHTGAVASSYYESLSEINWLENYGDNTQSIYYTVNNSRRISTIRDGMHPFVRAMRNDYELMTTLEHSVTGTQTATSSLLNGVSSGTSSGVVTETTITRTAGTISTLFLDFATKFAICLHKNPGEVRTTIGEIGHPGTETLVKNEINRLFVQHDSIEIMSLDLDANEGLVNFIVYTASDPLTAAYIVNLVRVQWDGSYWNRRASWMYVVDDTGVKSIHDIIPDLPPDVCVRDTKDLVTL